MKDVLERTEQVCIGALRGSVTARRNRPFTNAGKNDTLNYWSSGCRLERLVYAGGLLRLRIFCVYAKIPINGHAANLRFDGVCKVYFCGKSQK
jgi:hypothetical protein